MLYLDFFVVGDAGEVHALIPVNKFSIVYLELLKLPRSELKPQFLCAGL